MELQHVLDLHHFVRLGKHIVINGGGGVQKFEMQQPKLNQTSEKVLKQFKSIIIKWYFCEAWFQMF